jgi:glutamate-ammonia-ligase adenylyltransferase
MNQQQLQHTQACSAYASQVMQSLEALWLQDYAVDQFLQPLNRQQIAQLLDNCLAALTDEAQWMKALRQMRARLMLRWIWQDCNRLTDVPQLTQELSDFADLCVIAAKDFARPALIAKYGEPMGDDGQVQDLIVIAMGKHGAQELNLSSDIDLIFSFDENGRCNGRKALDVQQFCIQWGQKIIHLLDKITADGFVFRVDMRLRPWGDGSALALSHAALEKYLMQHGREWERYAWIKARAISGGQAGQELIEMTRPFVFRRYVDYSAFAALREMKAMIEKEVARRQIDDDVKLGAGGIREIEFIVQVYQLLYGGSRLELQDRQCLLALAHLKQGHLIDAQAYAELHRSYLFLRRVEHAIQALHDQQTQRLPQDQQQQQRLICALNFDTWQDFLACLNHTRQRVSYYFNDLINERIELVDPQPETDPNQDLRRCLDTQAQQQVKQFWKSQAVQRLPSSSLKRLEQFWPYWVKAVLASHQPQTAMLRLLPLIESVLRRSVYLVMLMESRGALQRLVKMAEVSPWICEELSRYPVLLDEFLSMDFELPQREELEQSLRQQLLRLQLDDVEDSMRVLRLFKKSNVLAVAASDVLAESPLMRVSDVLTDIAEVCVQAALQLAFKMVAAKHGYPLNQLAQRCSTEQLDFAIIGYGKVGGLELGYGSDLDLVFLHDYQEQAETDGPKAISGVEFAMRVAQKFMSLMTTQTLDGRVYEVDTRLRPNGEAGLLVTSLKAFELYQLNKAWLWEHQALVRARAIAGDPQLARAFQQLRCRILTQARDPQQVAQEVLNMRNKMKAHLGSSKEQKKHGLFHLKQDVGGIVDIEFMAQYAVLAWSGANPDLAHYSDNVRILDDAAQAGCLPSTDTTALTQAYLRERAESHRLALANQSLQVNAADWQTTREVVCKLWQRWIDPTMVMDLDSE